MPTPPSVEPAAPSQSQARSPSAPRLTGWRLHLARVLALVLVVALTVYLGSLREEARQLTAYGYPGIFLLSLLVNATLVLPIPGVALTFAAGAAFHPLGVGLAAGAGAALGELTGYLAGFSGQGVIQRTPIYERLEDLTRRYGGWMILVIAFIPNPAFDLAGMAAGALRMPLRRFLFWAWVGKTLKMLAFAYAGTTSADWLLRLLTIQP